MRISKSDWSQYRDMMSRLSKKAAQEFDDHFRGRVKDAERKEVIDYAMALVQKYSEASSELACQMYERIAELSGVAIQPAVPAETASYKEVAKGINGILKHSQTGSNASDVIDRLVKRAGADTMLQNTLRDGGQFAWVPQGDTCAFCITLASRGWQNISKKTLKKGHAEHIHAHCDCQYCVRFDEKTTVEGYDPDKYLEMYNDAAPGGKPDEKIKAMRQAKYQIDGDKTNARKWAAWARRKETEYEGIPKAWENIGVQSADEAMKGSNPNYRNHLPESLYGTKEDYTNNCANAVVAFEMRRRGYNVTACSLGENKKLKKDPFSAWKNQVPNKTKGDGLEEILTYMESAEDGTRIEITIQYPATALDARARGHAFIAEKNGDKIIFLDPQRNKLINQKIFTNTLPNGTMYMRIDNLEISDKGVTACKRVIYND